MPSPRSLRTTIATAPSLSKYQEVGADGPFTRATHELHRRSLRRGALLVDAPSSN